MKTVDFLETIAASDLKVGRCRQLRPKKNICVFPVTRPTLIFASDPNVFIGIPKK